MNDNKTLTLKILRATGLLLFMLIFVTFRYPAFRALWIGGLLLLAGFILLIMAGLKDEEIRKVPIISLRGYDTIIYILSYIMLSIALRHLDIDISTSAVRSLARNDVLFVIYLIFCVLSLIRVFLQPIRTSQ